MAEGYAICDEIRRMGDSDGLYSSIGTARQYRTIRFIVKRERYEAECVRRLSVLNSA
uniref:Uncharacterized protein n=1 Tax=Parascaris univalens TaxID=6257 RepID=A0A914ZTP6_PARUN